MTFFFPTKAMLLLYQGFAPIKQGASKEYILFLRAIIYPRRFTLFVVFRNTCNRRAFSSYLTVQLLLF